MMPEDGAETTVIFRAWKDKSGDVIALFPEEPTTYNALLCSCFEHVGQHGSASIPHVMGETRAAAPEEYADLKRELESAPYEYRLTVASRSTQRMLRTRKEKVRAFFSGSQP